MPLLVDFKIRFAEIPTVDADRYVPLLEPELPAYYGAAYSTDTKEIILQLLAHLVTLEIRRKSAPVQPVASKSVGSVSTSYAQSSDPTTGLEFFQTTRYGQRFLLLTSSRHGGYAV